MGFRVMDWVREGIEKVAKEKGGVPLSDVAHEAFVAYLKSHGIREPSTQMGSNQPVPRCFLKIGTYIWAPIIPMPLAQVAGL